jgi:hypothetical protein
MIVYLANKARFREDVLSNRIEEIVHDSFKAGLGRSVGASVVSHKRLELFFATFGRFERRAVHPGLICSKV